MTLPRPRPWIPARCATTAETIAKALGGRKADGGWMARCPAHDDREPSLSIMDAKDGKVLVRCHAGCDQERVIAALRSRGLWEEIGHRRFTRHAARGAVNDRPDRDIAKRSEAALAIWCSATPAGGTLVETYLVSRGLHIKPPPTLRCHAGLKHPSDSIWLAMVAGDARCRRYAACDPPHIPRPRRHRQSPHRSPEDDARSLQWRCGAALGPFGVTPGTIRTITGTAKGYKLEDFSDAFERYVTDTSLTPSQVNEIKGLRLDGAVTPVGVVTDRMERKVNNNGYCDGVTAKNGDDGQQSGDMPDLPHFLRRPPQMKGGFVTRTTTLIKELSQFGVTQSSGGDEIVLDGPEAVLTDARVQKLRAIRSEILRALADWDSADWQAVYDERAGIAEFDGGLRRGEAEALAFQECAAAWNGRC